MTFAERLTLAVRTFRMDVGAEQNLTTSQKEAVNEFFDRFITDLVEGMEKDKKELFSMLRSKDHRADGPTEASRL